MPLPFGEKARLEKALNVYRTVQKENPKLSQQILNFLLAKEYGGDLPGLDPKNIERIVQNVWGGRFDVHAKPFRDVVSSEHNILGEALELTGRHRTPVQILRRPGADPTAPISYHTAFLASQDITQGRALQLYNKFMQHQVASKHNLGAQYGRYLNQGLVALDIETTGMLQDWERAAARGADPGQLKGEFARFRKLPGETSKQAWMRFLEEKSQSSVRMVSIGAARLDPKTGKITLNKWTINPGLLRDATGKLDPELSKILWEEGAEEVHGLTMEHLAKKGKRLDVVARELQEFIGDRAIIGHNIKGFDLPVLQREFRRVHRNFTHGDVLDTYRMARQAFPESETSLRFNRRLDTLAEAFGVSLKKHHRAEDDALAALKVFEKMAQGTPLPASAAVRMPIIDEGMDFVPPKSSVYATPDDVLVPPNPSGSKYMEPESIASPRGKTFAQPLTGNISDVTVPVSKGPGAALRGMGADVEVGLYSLPKSGVRPPTVNPGALRKMPEMGRALASRVMGSAWGKGLGLAGLAIGGVALYRSLSERKTPPEQHPWGTGYAGLNEWIHRQSVGTRSKIQHSGTRHGHMGLQTRWPYPPQPSVNYGNRQMQSARCHA